MNLQKGQRFNLSKDAPYLTLVRVGLAWDTVGTASSSTDGDASDPFGSLSGGKSAQSYSFDSDNGRSQSQAPASGYSFGTSPTSVGSQAVDLDVSIFMLGSNGKLPADEFFVFYNNLRSPDGAVIHQGDNRTGVGEGDDESILVDLQRVDSRVQQILFVATIHEADQRSQSFSQVSNAYMRLLDNQTGKEVLRYSLTQKFSSETAVLFGELHRQNSTWRFHAIGKGSNDGLGEFVNRYA